MIKKIILFILIILMFPILVCASQTIYGNLYVQYNTTANEFVSRQDSFCNSSNCYSLSQFLNNTGSTYSAGSNISITSNVISVTVNSLKTYFDTLYYLKTQIDTLLSAKQTESSAWKLANYTTENNSVTNALSLKQNEDTAYKDGNWTEAYNAESGTRWGRTNQSEYNNTINSELDLKQTESSAWKIVNETYNTTQDMIDAVNQSLYYQFKVAWDNVLNKFITSVDNVYIHMIGTTLTLNETKLNTTIDARSDFDTDTKWPIDNEWLINESGILTFNETKDNESIDERIILHNDSLKSYVDDVNASMKIYVDELNVSQKTYIDTQDEEYNSTVNAALNLKQTESSAWKQSNYSTQNVSVTSALSLKQDEATAYKKSNITKDYPDIDLNINDDWNNQNDSLVLDNKTIIRIDNSTWVENIVAGISNLWKLTNFTNAFSDRLPELWNLDNFTEAYADANVSVTAAIDLKQNENTAFKNENVTLSNVNGTIWNKTGNNLYPSNIIDNVGIGISSPGAKLHIYDSSDDTRLIIETDKVDGIAALRYTNDGRTYSTRISGTDKFQIRDVTENKARLTIDTIGNVGIGTTSPGYKLDVIGDVNASNYYINGTSIFLILDNATINRSVMLDDYVLTSYTTNWDKSFADDWNWVNNASAINVTITNGLALKQHESSSWKLVNYTAQNSSVTNALNLKQTESSAFKIINATTLLDNGSIIRTGNVTNWDKNYADDMTYENITTKWTNIDLNLVDDWNWANNASAINSTVTSALSLKQTEASAFKNINVTTLLNNGSIIRTNNITWAIKAVNDSISSYYNHSISLDNYNFSVSLNNYLQSGGTLTSGRICRYDGVGIDCDRLEDASGACAAGSVCMGGHTHVGVNEVYGSGWNADTATPEKDDVYDYLHLFDSDDDGKFTDETWFILSIVNNITGYSITAWNNENDTSNYLTQLALNITRGDLITPNNSTWAGKYGNVTTNSQIANTEGYITASGSGVTLADLNNDTIIRSELNESWAIETVNDSINSYYNHSIDLSSYNKSVDLSSYNRSVMLDNYVLSADTSLWDKSFADDWNWANNASVINSTVTSAINLKQTESSAWKLSNYTTQNISVTSALNLKQSLDAIFKNINFTTLYNLEDGTRWKLSNYTTHNASVISALNLKLENSTDVQFNKVISNGVICINLDCSFNMSGNCTNYPSGGKICSGS